MCIHLDCIHLDSKCKKYKYVCVCVCAVGQVVGFMVAVVAHKELLFLYYRCNQQVHMNCVTQETFLFFLMDTHDSSTI